MWCVRINVNKGCEFESIAFLSDTHLEQTVDVQCRPPGSTVWLHLRILFTCCKNESLVYIAHGTRVECRIHGCQRNIQIDVSFMPIYSYVCDE